ncbi:MAG: non-homologous end-joining DNA ligase [Simkaniaceae bacterium]|nr:non-homologous end-joining DNA ligase [Simkaniaceae bacterium]
MAQVKISHPDKILFPKDNITKDMLIDYYRAVSQWMLPLLKDHPLVMQRFPDGIKHAGFYQKNISDYFPSWIASIGVKREAKGQGHLILCQNKNTLLYIANLACLTPHLWLSSSTKIDCPDRMIFDLDPPKGKFDLAIKAARALKDFLEKNLKLKAFVMTTGSRGLHVVIPIKPTHPFDEVRAFAKAIAAHIAEEHPKEFTIQPRKNRRRGRLFIDYLRNAYAQHAAAPYSIRPIDGAPIAMPVSWNELGHVHAQSFHLKNIKRHLSQRSNPWASFKSSHRNITRAIKKMSL